MPAEMRVVRGRQEHNASTHLEVVEAQEEVAEGRVLDLHHVVVIVIAFPDLVLNAVAQRARVAPWPRVVIEVRDEPLQRISQHAKPHLRGLIRS